MKVKESGKFDLKFNIQKMKTMASGPYISWQEMGKQWKQWQTLFSWAPRSLQMVTAAMKLKDACSLEGKLWPTSVQFSFSVMSDSLRPLGLQHARPPCPSPTPGVYSNSCRLSLWCHPTISFSVVAFLPPSIFPSIRVFSMSQFFASSGQRIGVSASASVHPVNTQDWFLLGSTGLIPLCCRKGDPFQGPKLGSCLTLGNELSEETRADKARDFIGKWHRVESSRGREPKRIASLCGLQYWVLWWWD